MPGQDGRTDSKLERNWEVFSSNDQTRAAGGDDRICTGLSEPAKRRIHPGLQQPIAPRRPTPRQIILNERFGLVKVSVRFIVKKSEARPNRLQTKILSVPQNRTGHPEYGCPPFGARPKGPCIRDGLQSRELCHWIAVDASECPPTVGGWRKSEDEAEPAKETSNLSRKGAREDPFVPSGSDRIHERRHGLH